MTAIAPTIPSSRKTGAAIATEPSISSPSLVAIPVMTIPPSVARNSGSVGVWSVIRSEVLGQDLVEDLGRREGEQRPTGRPGIER